LRSQSEASEATKLKRNELQRQLLPVILGDWLKNQDSSLQIFCGEAIHTLLKEPSFEFLEEFKPLLLQRSQEMLDLWDSEVLDIWTEVFALAVARLNKDTPSEK
jgi:hypothetical protein